MLVPHGFIGHPLVSSRFAIEPFVYNRDLSSIDDRWTISRIYASLLERIMFIRGLKTLRAAMTSPGATFFSPEAASTLEKVETNPFASHAERE